MVVGLVRPLPAAAQQPAATGQPAELSAEEQRERLANYVRVMTGELERVEARVSAVTAQLVSLDDDIESRVNRIVSLLSSVRDSMDASDTRMRKAKEDALAGLKETALYYARERDRRKKEMGNEFSRIDDDALAADVAALNARIETRVTQSLDIAASLVQHEEGRTDKYQDSDTDNSVETREFRKAEKDASASAKVKADLAADLGASIAKLERDIRAREAELKTSADPQRQAQLSQDIETMRQTIEARRNQAEALVTAAKPATRAVGSAGAFEMDKMLDEMTLELKRDFAKFKSLVAERDAALARVKPLKVRLEDATAAIEARRTSDR
jgi:hypothetical protein